MNMSNRANTSILIAIAMLFTITLAFNGCGKSSEQQQKPDTTYRVRLAALSYFHYVGRIAVGRVKTSRDGHWASTTVTAVDKNGVPRAETLDVLLKRVGSKWSVYGYGTDRVAKCGSVPANVLFELFGYRKAGAGC